MKRPIVDKFIQTDGSPYVENTETGEEIVYYPNKRSNLVLRSMFEEDIDVLSGMKRSYRKKLLNKLKEKQEENSCFLVEEMYQYNADGSRKVIAFAILDANENTEVNLFLKGNPKTRLFEFAKMQLLQRITIIFNDLYELTDATGTVTVNRVS